MKNLSLLYIYLVLLIFTSCSSASQNNEENSAVVLDNIFARTSIRAYKDKQVEKEKVDNMLRAAMAAPSGKDMRPWEFVVINERATLDSLAAALPYAKMLAQAHSAIVVCGDSTRSSYWYLDCSAATQNILLAAQSQGLGAVWTAAYPYEDRMKAVRKYTKLPRNILPLCVIPFGYPVAEQQPKQKYDESKIHYNRF